MIAFLRGKLLQIEGEHAVVDVQGVGYEVNTSTTTLADLNYMNEKGKDVAVYVFTHVREDAIQLYGFSTKTEKELFLSLNKVNGIGPKMAQKILSGTNTENLIHMIESEDVSGLSRLPKVGKKTAEQMVLSLKGKLVIQREATETQGSRRDILSALVNLGFKVTDAEKVVTRLPVETSLEEGVRLGLQALTSL